MRAEALEYSWPALSFFSLVFFFFFLLFWWRLFAAVTHFVDDFTGVTESDDKLITWQSRNAAARDAG